MEKLPHIKDPPHGLDALKNYYAKINFESGLTIRVCLNFHVKSL